jgi:hypothetical protein
MVLHSYITFILIIQSSIHSSSIRSSSIRNVWTEAIWSYKTNSDSTFSHGNASDRFYKGPIQLDTELSLGVAMRVAALQAVTSVAMASVAMAAQQMTARQVAVLQAVALQVAALQMAAWWASLVVLAALVAVRQVLARADWEDLAVGDRHTAKAVAVWVAKAKAVHEVT